MTWGGETDDELSDWYMQAQYFHNGSHAQVTAWLDPKVTNYNNKVETTC